MVSKDEPHNCILGGAGPRDALSSVIVTLDDVLFLFRILLE